MLVKDFVEYEITGALFEVVDADKVGYITFPTTIEVADRNVVSELYGEYKVIGFSPKSSKRIYLYVSNKKETCQDFD